MTHSQTSGQTNTDKEIKMAMERKFGKSTVKITGTAKSTGGNAKNQPMKSTAVAKSADAARAGAMAKDARPKRPMGELPKRMSGFAQVIAQDYPELGKSGAAALAGKITKEFVTANKAAAAKKAALAKKIK
jgi:hypothetical protein